MKPLNLIFAILIILFTSCSKNITVNKDNYYLKTFDDSNDQTVQLEKYHSPNLRGGQDAEKIIIVCASGGGSRAATFTMGVLLELEKILYKPEATSADSSRNLLNEIDYFSTVSGGGWGVSSFLSYKYQNIEYETNYKITNPYKRFNDFELYLTNRADFRYAKHQTWYFLGSIFKSCYRRSDRAYTNRLNAGYLGWMYRRDLEDSLSMVKYRKHIDESTVKAITLGDVFKLKEDQSKPLLPMLIPNTVNIDNFKLVPFTPDRLNYWGFWHYNHYIKAQTPVISSAPLTDKELLGIPLALGIKASSSVPGFIGSNYFKSKKDNIDYYLHLQDGGIVDNQGLHTAKAILKHNDTFKEKKNRILIIIDASGSGIQNAKKFKKKILSRRYSVNRSTLWAIPDAQYPLMRERIRAIGEEYNCEVVYLGTEVLLDTRYGLTDSIKNISISQKELAGKLDSMYTKVLNNPNYFNTLNMTDRSLLYEYINKNVSTWFATKESPNKGKYLTSKKLKKGTGLKMLLAGRGVVQLKRAELNRIINQ